MRVALLILGAVGYGLPWVAGCGFRAADAQRGDDLGAVADDLAGSDDLYGTPPGSDLAHVTSNGCPPPVLLVGVEDLDNNHSFGGRVARVSLAGGNASPCATLSGQGMIDSQPMAVAALGGYVAAATPNGLYLVDPSSDTVKWSKPIPFVTENYAPFDAFSLSSPSGTQYIAVAWGIDHDLSGGSIRDVEAYDAAGSPAAGSPWCIRRPGCSVLAISSSTYGMAAHPLAPAHFLALDGGNQIAAIEVNPWATPSTKTQYVGAYSEPLTSIYSVTVGGTRHLAWFDKNMSGGAIQWSIDDGSGTPVLNGPVKCTSTCAAMLHVVPDPTAANGFFALCEGATFSERTVVRADDAGSCVVVLDGAPFGVESRLSRLGIAP